MEIINNGQITPKRLISTLKVVSKFGEISQKDLQSLLQPEFLEGDQSASKAVINAAIRLGLISLVGNEKKTISLHPSISLNGNLSDLEDYRQLFQKKFLGVLSDSQDNYLLNLVIAWNAVKGPSIVGLSKDEVARKFNVEMSSKDAEALTREGRMFNSTKLNAWITWASYLGFGWEYSNQFFPDAHYRVRPVISELKGSELPISYFMEILAEQCPELDCGNLFKYCLQELNLAGSRGNNISLMLSTGLRVLNQSGEIKLLKRGDSQSNWSLHKASGYTLTEISHIQI